MVPVCVRCWRVTDVVVFESDKKMLSVGSLSDEYVEKNQLYLANVVYYMI